MPKAPPPKVQPFQPFWTSPKGEATLYHGHVIDVLRQLPERFVQTVVTSPPYWGLRSYLPSDHNDKQLELGSEPSPDCGTKGQAQCGRCFVCSMVAVFRGVRRVLRDDGTVWLNLGDTFGGGKCGGGNVFSNGRTDGTSTRWGSKYAEGEEVDPSRESMRDRTSELKLPSGNLIGIPWRVALALQEDGWILRQDIIWSKPSPMPESVTNRCTKSHEYIFLRTKRMGYYYDAEAIKEPMTYGDDGRKPRQFQWIRGSDPKDKRSEESQVDYIPTGNKRNKRSVWTISSESYSGAHYAVFPTKLVEPCILAGTSERGCCAQCGTPYERIVAKEQLKRKRPNDYVKRTGADGTGNSCANTVAGVDVRTLGWEPSCKCHNVDTSVGVKPCVVLDPFVGSGTSVAVAVELGRHGLGIDLSATYLQENAIPRIEGSIYNALDRRFIKQGKGGKWFKKSLG